MDWGIVLIRPNNSVESVIGYARIPGTWQVAAMIDGELVCVTPRQYNHAQAYKAAHDYMRDHDTQTWVYLPTEVTEKVSDPVF